MLTRKIYSALKDGVLNGYYKRIRLVRISKEGEREILTTYNSYVRGGESNTIKRLDFIRHNLEKILEPGDYIIEATTTPTGNGGIVSPFNIKKHPITIPITAGGDLSDEIEDHTKNQETMTEFDIDEYKDLLKQISKLESIVEVQKLKILYLEHEIKKTPLHDQGSGVMKLIEEHAPTAMRIFDNFLTQRDRGLDLKDRELTLAENGIKKKKVAPKNKSRAEILSDMENLYDQNEDSFCATMAEMKQKDPQLYEFINDSMFEEEEEEKEKEKEEN